MKTRAHLIFAFSLVSAALARIVMQMMSTRVLDAGAADTGVVIAAAVGALTGFALAALRDRPGWRRRVWAIVPIAGAAVGMTMQALLLMSKPDYRVYVVTEGVDSRHPVAWILIGAPFGALPALVAGALLFIALRVASQSRTPALDARERMLVPMIGGCAVLHAIALAGAEGGDILIVIFVLALSVFALFEIFMADRKRASLIARIFAGNEPSYAIESMLNALDKSVPLAVGGIAPSLLIVTDVGERGYRRAAREPFAAIAETPEETLRPVLRRQKILAGVFGATAIAASVAMLSR